MRRSEHEEAFGSVARRSDAVRRCGAAARNPPRTTAATIRTSRGAQTGEELTKDNIKIGFIYIGDAQRRRLQLHPHSGHPEDEGEPWASRTTRSLRSSISPGRRCLRDRHQRAHRGRLQRHFRHQLRLRRLYARRGGSPPRDPVLPRFRHAVRPVRLGKTPTTTSARSMKPLPRRHRRWS